MSIMLPLTLINIKKFQIKYFIHTSYKLVKSSWSKTTETRNGLRDHSAISHLKMTSLRPKKKDIL